MRLLAISIVFMVLLMVGFGVGLATQQSLILLSAFCAWSPAVWLVGYAMARTGITIVMSHDHAPTRQSSNGRVPARRRVQQSETFQ